MTLSAGIRLGPYEIVSPLGAGGMGEVYKARDTRLGREVAVKVLPAEFAADPERLRRFEQEAKALAALNHPNILFVLDVGELAGTPYVVTELLEGESLRQRLRGGPLSPAKAVELATQITQGLAAAHAKGIVHRDLKPENLFVTNDGRVKILDFGLAKLLAQEPSAEDGGCAESVTRDVPTETGRVMGTLGYMAPEQARGEPTDARSDVFSFGVVLYEMLSGKRPFERPSTADAFAALLKEDPPPLPKGLPSPLDRVVRRCLEKRPQDRYASAGELALALETLPGTALRQSAAGVPSPSMARGALPRWVFPSVVVIVLGIAVGGVLLWRPWVQRSRPAGMAAVAGRAIRMAVLPFANLSGDPEQDYLSDGLTQEMISQLGRLHPATLSVIARTSIMQYKKSEKTVDQIGRELGVDYILEGSAQREGSRIRITAELIRVGDQAQLWADGFEREMAGVLALQSDVARKVAESLALKLLPAEQARLAGAKTVDPEVYDLCLKGLYYTERLSKADLDTAERYFQLALAKDRASAVAHAGMAMVWACRQQMGITPARESGPKAKAAALEAVRLDDTLSKAHSTLGSILAWTDFNFPEAEREYRRALELDPNDANARAAYSHVLMILRRPDEAMPQIERAVAIDPLNAFNLSFYAFDLICARRYDEALSQARAALRVQPDAPAATSALILTLHLKNLHDEAIATAAATYAGSIMGWPDVAEALKKGYAESGYAAALRRAAELETAKYGDLPGVAIDAAINYAMAGDRPRTLDWLEKAYEQRDPNMPYIGCMPTFDALRSEPRFQALLRKMNLPVEMPAGPTQPTRPPS